MKVKVTKKSYLFGELIPADTIYDFPDDKIIRDENGNPRFGSNIEVIGKPSKAQAKPEVKEVKASDTDGEADEDSEEDTQDQGEDGDKQPTREDIITAALDSLDPAVEAHWVKKTGKPDLNALKEIVGFEVKREEVDAIDANFVRPVKK